VYLKLIILESQRGASTVLHLFFGGFTPIIPGIYERVLVTLEEVFDHLTLQNVFEHLRRYFSGDQTLFQNPERCGVQVGSELSSDQVHSSHPLHLD
jgi:hypothetical protein